MVVSLIPREELEKVQTKENADELFIFLISDPNPERQWNFGVFIAHMEGMREQLRTIEQLLSPFLLICVVHCPCST